MSRRLFAPTALRELRAASVYIARDNWQAGEALLDSALQAARLLVDQPGLGHTGLGYPARYRFWSLTGFPYVLVYDTATQPIRILRVVHLARDLPTLLAELRA